MLKSIETPIPKNYYPNYVRSILREKLLDTCEVVLFWYTYETLKTHLLCLEIHRGEERITPYRENCLPFTIHPQICELCGTLYKSAKWHNVLSSSVIVHTRSQWFQIGEEIFPFEKFDVHGLHLDFYPCSEEYKNCIRYNFIKQCYGGGVYSEKFLENAGGTPAGKNFFKASSYLIDTTCQMSLLPIFFQRCVDRFGIQPFDFKKPLDYVYKKYFEEYKK